MPHIDISLAVTVQAQPQIYSRALGGGAPLSTENILHHTTSTQAMEAVTPTSTALGAEESDGQSTGGGLTKSILEWAFALAALVIVASLAVWKYTRIKRNRARALANASLDPSGHYIRARAYALSNPLAGSNLGADTSYPTFPNAYPVNDDTNTSSHDQERAQRDHDPRRSRRAARGLDIDSGGRRGGGRTSEDGDGDDDDELPAYEPKGGPPKYIEVGLVAGGVAVEMSEISSRTRDETGSESRRERSESRSRMSGEDPRGPPPGFEGISGESSAPRASTSRDGAREQGDGVTVHAPTSTPTSNVVEERDITDVVVEANTAMVAHDVSVDTPDINTRPTQLDMLSQLQSQPQSYTESQSQTQQESQSQPQSHSIQSPS